MTRRFPQFPTNAAVIILLAHLSTGCALSTRNAALTYPPDPEGGLVATAAASPATSPAGRVITVLPFVDRREDTSKVGNVRNGFGMKMAPIRATNSVPGWVQYALVVELRRAGFDATAAAAAPDSTLSIGGAVLGAETDAYFTYGAEVKLEVSLMEGSRPLFLKAYEGKGGGGMNVGASAKSYSQTLSRALQDALMAVVADVRVETASEAIGVRDPGQ